MIKHLIKNDKKSGNVLPEKYSAFRCNSCNKLLAKENMEGKIAGQIKCPRCGTINEI
ncbi:MAG: Com family DNA-binding transcriptional regulator [Candidatus Aminicenantes bacterium]|nr:Com family DNA-binding transcriptional regulator [Candidatus Aminicenantes bacterium]